MSITPFSRVPCSCRSDTGLHTSTTTPPPPRCLRDTQHLRPPCPRHDLTHITKHEGAVLAVGALLFLALREGRFDPDTGLFSEGGRPRPSSQGS